VFIGCLVIGVAAMVPGCNRKAAYPGVRLEGAVTVKGDPLAEGGIQFLVEGDKTNGAPVVGGVIREGRYAVDGVPLGDVRVVLKSVRSTKPFPPGHVPTMQEIMSQKFINMIPEKYREGIVIKVTEGQSVQDLKL
jgi:hypothetical protein